MNEVLLALEAFLARHPRILTAARTLGTAIVTAILLELGLGDLAGEVVSTAESVP